MTRAFRGVSKTMDIGVAAPQLQTKLSVSAPANLAFDDFYAANAARIGRDGIEWSVVWFEEDAGFGDFPQIIVGDGEVLIRQWTVSGVVRSIPLPE